MFNKDLPSPPRGWGWLLFSVVFMTISNQAFAGIAFVQSNSKDSGAGTVTSDTVSFSSNTKPHNMIVVAVRRGGSSGNVTVTDSQGNTYFQAASQDSGTDHRTIIYYASNIVGGANTVTTTFDISRTMRVAIHEYSGISPSNPLDKTATASGTSTTPDSGSVTTTKPKELIFAASTSDDPVTDTAGSGFTLREALGGNKLATEDKVVSSTGSYSGSFSINTSDPWTALVATFRDDSPVAWYKLDEGAGTSAADSSGNGYVGALGALGCTPGTGVCPTWSSSARYGSALSFDGDDYVNMGDVNAIDGLKAITVTLWIKSATSNSAATETHFVQKSGCLGTTDDGTFELLAGAFTSHKATFLVLPSGGVPSDYVYADGVTTIDDTKWHHLAGVYDGSKVYLYVDGRQDGSTSLASVTLGSTTTVLDIGGYCNGHPPLNWNGLIDDVRIYDRALTPAEIRKIFQGGNAMRWQED